MKSRTKKVCDKCNKEISISNFKKHYDKCGIIKVKVKKEKFIKQCPYCNKEFKNVKFHIWACHTEKGKNWHPNKGKISPIKGRKSLYKHTQIAKEQISKNNKGGGGKHASGGSRRCKWYETKKLDGTIVKVQGTYEKRFAEILNYLDKDWVKPVSYKDNLNLIWIDDNKKEHLYFPDFWCPNLQKFFEVKGWYSNKDKIKMKYILSHYNNVEIIFLNDIKKYEQIYFKNNN